ncbi:hypothetical protein Vafri_14293 [Volvox africanus]|uniref:Uncharacterized protein n=1 Tax=Volvox africanus TaxID=51714 RepID=A0A8J4F4A8_9CHLO|nr:hypothetical protein Vafri_14293 [Volvox africanus]
MMGALMANLSAQQQASSGAPTASAASPFPSDCSAGELAAAFFSLADRYLVFARDLLLTGQGAAALPTLVEWVCGVIVSMREREPVAAALSFLSHLLSAAARLAAEETSGGVGGGGGGGGATAAETRAGYAGPRRYYFFLPFIHPSNRPAVPGLVFRRTQLSFAPRPWMLSWNWNPCQSIPAFPRAPLTHPPPSWVSYLGWTPSSVAAGRVWCTPCWSAERTPAPLSSCDLWPGA